ncbi:MAG: CBS domain-containing protein [Phycisphaerales bacterium]
MATAEQLVTIKGGAVAQLPPGATALAAAQLMCDRRIGSVLVVDEGRIVGIFTERDVLGRIVGARRDPARTALHEVMSAPVACAAPYTTLDELRLAMRERRIRHIPVVDIDRLLGIISIGDLNRAEQQVHERTIAYLEQFVGAS